LTSATRQSIRWCGVAQDHPRQEHLVHLADIVGLQAERARGRPLGPELQARHVGDPRVRHVDLQGVGRSRLERSQVARLPDRLLGGRADEGSSELRRLRPARARGEALLHREGPHAGEPGAGLIAAGAVAHHERDRHAERAREGCVQLRLVPALAVHPHIHEEPGVRVVQDRPLRARAGVVAQEQRAQEAALDPGHHAEGQLGRALDELGALVQLVREEVAHVAVRV
jgi:hypothetical protein